MLKELCFIQSICTNTNDNKGLDKAWNEFKQSEFYNPNETYVTMFQLEDNGDMFWEFYQVK